MKNLVILIFISLFLSFCRQNDNVMMESSSGPSERILTEKEYLIEAKIISDTEYLVVCKGYPKPGLTNPVQIEGTARESALLYAQFSAQKRLKNIDTTKGTIKKFEFNGEFGIVHYVIEAENIRACLK